MKRNGIQTVKTKKAHRVAIAKKRRKIGWRRLTARSNGLQGLLDRLGRTVDHQKIGASRPLRLPHSLLPMAQRVDAEPERPTLPVSCPGGSGSLSRRSACAHGHDRRNGWRERRSPTRSWERRTTGGIAWTTSLIATDASTSCGHCWRGCGAGDGNRERRSGGLG